MHVRRLQLAPAAPAASSGGCAFGSDTDSASLRQQAEVAIAAARVALSLCSAHSCEAAAPEDALCVFGPAVSQLSEAFRVIQRQQPEGSAAHGGPMVELLHELTPLARRALASMHATLEQQQLRQALPGCQTGSHIWRCQLRSASAAETVQTACTVSAAICSLCTALRLHSNDSNSSMSGAQWQQVHALAAATAGELRLLSPYATSGLLAQLALMVSWPL